MSTIDLGLLLNGMDRRPGSTRSRDSVDSAEAPLRIVLVQGEALRLPSSRTRLGVLTGTAWVTQSGQDRVLLAGETLTAAAAADCPVVSALGPVPLLLEVR